MSLCFKANTREHTRELGRSGAAAKPLAEMLVEVEGMFLALVAMLAFTIFF